MGQVRKKTLRKKKKHKSHKVIVLLLLIIATTIFAMITPIFTITEIKVEGNSKLDKETVISLSGLTKGQNIFRNLKSQVQNNLKENSYIKEATMKRVLPGTIELKIIERKIAFQIKLIDGYVYIDNQGYILENNSKKKKVPLLEGLTTTQEELLNGKRLNIEDLNRLNTILKIIDSAKSIKAEKQITIINAENVNEYILYLNSEKKYVYLGDASNLNNKILYMQMMLKKEKGIIGTMFINGDLNEGFKPYFREDINKKGDKNE